MSAMEDPFNLRDTNSSNVTSVCYGQEDLNVWGLVAIIVFYLAVLLVGLYAGWKKRGEVQDQEQVMLAGRDIGLFVGVLTMGATWVGGGFINGSAEEAYNLGLIWVQAPFGYSIALIICGTFYAQKMREAEYVTMIDPFTQKYGKWGALQVLPAAFSEILWSASILGALGSTLQVILNLEETISIIVSSVIALLYTLLGGLISVAYTDVVQMFFIVFGMFLALPFALTHPAVGDIYEAKLEDGSTPAWYGEVAPQDWGLWVDYAFLLVCGGIPWQCYYQRVLSSKTALRAQMLSYGGAAIAFVMIAPSVLFGAIARSTRWNETEYPCGAPSKETAKVVVPLVLQYLTPPVVAFFGLGAVSAAVMSSTDSSMLSASTMLARNVYKKVFRPRCSEREVLYALWVLIVINCAIATTLAIVYKSIYELFVLCGDFMFVIVFPQLTLVLFYNMANTYGSVSSFFVGVILRLLCGEEQLGLGVVLSFGTIYGAPGSCPTPLDPLNPCRGVVPFRTIVTIIGFLVHMGVSYATFYIFSTRRLDLTYDFFNCFHTKGDKIILRASRHLRETDELLKMSGIQPENGAGVCNAGFSVSTKYY